MPRLNVSTRKRVIILRRQGYALKDVRRRLGEEGIVVSMRTLQRLCAKFKEMGTIQDIPRTFKCQVLNPQMPSAMDQCLRNDDELTARKLKTRLHEQFPYLRT